MNSVSLLVLAVITLAVVAALATGGDNDSRKYEYRASPDLSLPFTRATR